MNDSIEGKGIVSGSRTYEAIDGVCINAFHVGWTEQNVSEMLSILRVSIRVSDWTVEVLEDGHVYRFWASPLSHSRNV